MGSEMAEHSCHISWGVNMRLMLLSICTAFLCGCGDDKPTPVIIIDTSSSMSDPKTSDSLTTNDGSSNQGIVYLSCEDVGNCLVGCDTATDSEACAAACNVQSDPLATRIFRHFSKCVGVKCAGDFQDASCVESRCEYSENVCSGYQGTEAADGIRYGQENCTDAKRCNENCYALPNDEIFDCIQSCRNTSEPTAYEIFRGLLSCNPNFDCADWQILCIAYDVSP